jgi:acetate CoA/acetoacetate CoA-transferase beta subunit
MHTAKGKPKILKRCTLPLTSTRPVSLIVTELAVLEPTSDGLLLKEVAPGVSAQDVTAVTDATLVIPTNVPTMRLAP